MKLRVAEIVAAYVGHNAVSPDQLPALIASVNLALASLSQPPAVVPSPLTPAVPIRRSVQADKITCLECGWSGQMLKRHLNGAHSTNPADYRTKWGLPPDYPMTAGNYAARRSELAKQIGLGKRAGAGGRRRAAAS